VAPPNTFGVVAAAPNTFGVAAVAPNMLPEAAAANIPLGVAPNTLDEVVVGVPNPLAVVAEGVANKLVVVGDPKVEVAVDPALDAVVDETEPNKLAVVVVAVAPNTLAVVVEATDEPNIPTAVVGEESGATGVPASAAVVTTGEPNALSDTVLTGEPTAFKLTEANSPEGVGEGFESIAEVEERSVALALVSAAELTTPNSDPEVVVVVSNSVFEAVVLSKGVCEAAVLTILGTSLVVEGVLTMISFATPPDEPKSPVFEDNEAKPPVPELGVPPKRLDDVLPKIEADVDGTDDEGVTEPNKPVEVVVVPVTEPNKPVGVVDFAVAEPNIPVGVVDLSVAEPNMLVDVVDLSGTELNIPVGVEDFSVCATEPNSPEGAVDLAVTEPNKPVGGVDAAPNKPLGGVDFSVGVCEPKLGVAAIGFAREVVVVDDGVDFGGCFTEGESALATVTDFDPTGLSEDETDNFSAKEAAENES